ncbi:MAG: porin family protein [Gammaproteobacteria bacterium]|nr:porin family protein [Gammaproteobacteria bacterium]
MAFNKPRVFRNVKACIAILLIALFAMPMAQAEGTYMGIGYGRAKSEDIETGNLGFVIGRSPDKGAGFEFFYAPTIVEDDISSGPLSADITVDSYGILVYYKTGTDDFDGYLKIKGGVAVVDLEFDFDGIGSIDDDTSGFTYGIALGFQMGSGALEISYLILPDFDDFQGIEVDAEVGMFSITYQWNFE